MFVLCVMSLKARDIRSKGRLTNGSGNWRQLKILIRYLDSL